MATQSQIEANRRNAQKSTGPRTQEGKERSRANALKHGLSGDGVVTLPDDAAIIDERRRSWRELFGRLDAEQEHLFEVMVVNSVRVERCQRLEVELTGQLSGRAAVEWDEDRRLAAEQVAVGLQRRPALTVRTLRQTPQGCDWLLDRWESLAESLADGGTWDEDQTELALDLLGVPLGASEKLPWDETNPPAVLVAEVMKELEERKKSIEPRDSLEQAGVMRGVEFSTPPALARLRRYENACHRKFLWARKELQIPRSFADRAKPKASRAIPFGLDDMPPDPLYPRDPGLQKGFPVKEFIRSLEAVKHPDDLVHGAVLPAPNPPVKRDTRPLVAPPAGPQGVSYVSVSASPSGSPSHRPLHA